MTLSFTQRGWDDYQHWIKNDKRMLRRINERIKAIQRDPFGGIGKPEPLRNQLQGFWSRRISDEHRLVYVIADGTVTIIGCRFHY